ncbi:MAG: FG-GAP repeat domain-containing protein [Bryobacteraceae bacterium]
MNDGKGKFMARNLGKTTDRTYTAALGDLDGDGLPDLVVSNDAPHRKLVYRNIGDARFELNRAS